MYLFIYRLTTRLSLKLIYHETTATLGTVVTMGVNPGEQGDTSHPSPRPSHFARWAHNIKCPPYLSNWSNIQIFTHVSAFDQIIFFKQYNTSKSRFSLFPSFYYSIIQHLSFHLPNCTLFGALCAHLFFNFIQYFTLTVNLANFAARFRAHI